MAHTLTRLVLLLPLAAAGACGHVTSGDDTPTGPAKDVEEALDRLGVNRDVGQRVDDTGTALPDNYSPYGPTATLNKTDEIFFVGAHLMDPANPGTALTSQLGWAQDDQGQAAILRDQDTDPPWATDPQQSRRFAQSLRAATAADVDGDGFEETAVVFVDPTDANHDQEVQLTVFANAEAATPYASTTQVLAVQPGVVDVAVTAADLDGDGKSDLVIGVSTGTDARLMFALSDGSKLTVNKDATKSVQPLNSGAEMAWALSAGQLDYDAGQEVTAVLNEHTGSVGSDTGVARYFVYDDAGAGEAELAKGPVQATDGSIHTAVVADVSMGDIDGDHLDEIVFGGLEDYTYNCDGVEYMFDAIDDQLHGLADLGGHAQTTFLSQCPDNSPWYLRYVYVNTADIDGDGVAEVQAGPFVFDDWRAAAPFTPLFTISQDAFVTSNDFGWMDANTTDVEVGDVTGDGRADVLVYSQDESAISVWSDDQINGFGKVSTLPVEFKNSQGPANALLVPVNLDKDSTVLKYTGAEHKLIFTEPVVLAALAAPPCQDGIAQNYDACTTTFGTATSQTVSKDQVLTVSASASVGFKVEDEITQSGLQIKATLTASASHISSQSYSLTRSVVYTTGSQQDSVIFTTIPYDQYTYTVMSAPDPAMVGTEVVVSLPREPITLIADRTFYNQSITADALHIGDDVFQHTVGDITTYPTRSDERALIQRYGGLETDEQSVGQGTGSTEIGLSVGQEYSEGNSLSLGFEFEVEATGATVLGGFSVGASAENTLTVTSGSETSYTGSIGSISGDDFQNNIYKTGLFTYVYPDAGSGQEFEVVDYWVDPVTAR